MADYTLANLGNPAAAVTAIGQPAVQTFEIEVDATKLSAPLAALDTIDVLAVPAGFCVLASSIEVIEAMEGTSLVGAAFNLEEQAGATDLSGTVTPTTVGNKTQATIGDAGAAATNLEMVFALTSGTVTKNGKYRVKIVGCAL